MLMLLVCLTALANPSSSFQLRTTGISTGRPDRCEVPLDEVLLSRQLLVYGRGAQTQLGRAHVVLAPAGCSTVLLGEVSRQLVMIGLGRLSIVAADRDQIAHVLRMLEDFNSAVDIQIHHTLEDIKDHVDAVIAVDMSLSETAALNLVCRERKTKMFACRVIGPTGYVFCDLQSHWVLSHTAHEPASSVPLLSLILDGDDRAHIKCIEDERMPVGVNDSCVIKVGATNVTATVVSMVSYREALVTTSFRNQGKLADLAADFGSKGGSVQKIVPVSLVKHKCFGDVINRPSFESINGCLAPEESMEKSIGVLAAHIAHDVALLSPSVCSSTSPKFVKNRFIKSAKNAAIFLKERMNSNEVNSDKASAVLRPLSRAARWLRSGMRLGPNFSITCRGLLESFFQEAFLPSLLGGGRRKDLMVSSVTAGVISQEVVKAVTNTDMPISQLLMFENLVPQLPLRSELKNRSLRDGRCARILVVGAGAIGCEVLRNLALGIDNTAERGRNRAYLEDEGIIYIADNDAVEKSNLNRQLLFRARDIGKFKADMAATSINNELDQINQRNCDLSSMRRKWKVVPIVGKVGRGDSDESPIFTDSFWEGLDVVVSAVDTVEARLAIDEHCCRHGIPLVDAGTQGLLGSTQVILPGCTERYADSADPEMGQTPVCTIKSFPYAVNHCVAWALQKLQTLCVEEVGIMSNLLTVRDCNVAERALAVLGVEDLRSFGDWVDAMRTLRVLDKMDAATNSSDSLRSVVPDLIDKLGKGKEQLMVAVFVEYAFKLFFRLFERETATLIQQHPANSVDESGVAFWSGSRQQMPRVESWPLFASHYKLSCLQEFVIHTTILKARVSGIQLDEITVLDMIDQFEALNAIRLIREIVLANDADPMDVLSLQNKIVNGARTLINSDNASNPFDFRPFVFEKDVQDGQVDFLAAAAGIRCHSYRIPLADSKIVHKSNTQDLSDDSALDPLFVRAVAGRIVPAVLSTTTVCSALASMEVSKILDDIDLQSRLDTKKLQRGLLGLLAKLSINSKSFLSPLKPALSALDTMQRLHPIKSRLHRQWSNKDRFRSSFVNLASPCSLSYAAPPDPTMLAVFTTGEEFTAWDYVEVPGTANQVKVNDIVSFIENRFQVHLRMLLHGDIILYNEATTAPTQLQITMYPGGLAKVGLCKSVPSICLSAAIGDFEPTAIVNGNTKLFYDLKCQCVDRASGDYVDVPKFRVACGAVMPTEHTPLVLSVS